MPPRASAMRRNATSSTRGSSASSNFMEKKRGAHSSSAPFRSRGVMLVGHDRAAIRCCLFLLLLSQECQLDNVLSAVAGELDLVGRGVKFAGVVGVRRPGSRQEVGVAVLVEDQLGAAIGLRR